MISKTRLPAQALAVSEQRAACAPDAFRFCVGYIPDPTRVEHCLRQNMSDLSDACRSVFEQNARLLASKAPRGPGRPTRPAISEEVE
jgi:hypothetical protein